MKKLISALSILSILAISLFGCKKDKVNNGATSLTPQYAEAQARISQIRLNVSNFKSMSHAGMKTTAQVPDWATIGGADVTGASQGFKWGGKIGALCFGEAIPGMAAGLVLGGILGSSFAWWKLHGSRVAPEGTGNTNWWYQSNSTAEQVGYRHNSFCTKIIIDHLNLPNNATDFADVVYDDACSYVATAYNLPLTAVKEGAPLTEVKTYLESYSFATGSLSSNMALIGASINDQQLLDYVTNLEADLISCDALDVADGIAFCEAYVTLVNADNSLSVTKKTQLSNAFTLGKYSIGLWTNN